MRLLLDTATLLWWMMNSSKLSTIARDALQAADSIFVSGITAMELSTKLRIGKLPEARLLVDEFHKRVDEEGFLSLPLSATHGLLAGQIASAHRDPFDRMLAAQAISEKLVIVSPDTAFDELGARRIW